MNVFPPFLESCDNAQRFPCESNSRSRRATLRLICGETRARARVLIHSALNSGRSMRFSNCVSCVRSGSKPGETAHPGRSTNQISGVERRYESERISAAAVIRSGESRVSLFLPLVAQPSQSRVRHHPRGRASVGVPLGFTDVQVHRLIRIRDTRECRMRRDPPFLSFCSQVRRESAHGARCPRDIRVT